MRILFFGRLAETLGREIDLDVPAPCTIAELRIHLREAVPNAAPQLTREKARACIDQVMVGEGALAAPGREIAFVPPLSGG